MKVTTDDLLAALQAALEKPNGEGQTVQELGQTMGCGEEKVRRLLREVARQGRLTASRVQRPSIDGRLMWVPAYQIKGK